VKRFNRILREINRKLDLPQPEKSRILIEIGSDLEDMYQLFISEGYSEEAAIGRAEEKFDISDEALIELVGIHQSMISRLLSGISEQAQSRWEKTILVAVLLLIVIFSGPQFFSKGFFRQVGPYIWPFLGISLFTGVMTLRQSYLIFLKKDHQTRKLRKDLIWFLVTACGSLFTGIYGWSVETYRMAASAAADFDSAFIKLINWAFSSSAVMMTALLISIASGVIWFMLAGRIRRIEEAETAWLRK